MGIVFNMRTPKGHSWIAHHLGFCKRYNDKSYNYNCPKCSKTMYCYWQGNDIAGHGTDYCDKCAKRLESITKN